MPTDRPSPSSGVPAPAPAPDAPDTPPPDTRLDEASLLAEARRQTGLEDFGDESFREPLRKLLWSFEHEARLTPAGRVGQRARIVGLLVARLQTRFWLARHPEIEDEEVDVRFVVVGFPRTGTTLLQRILARDPRSGWLAWWECRQPAPLPGWRPDEAKRVRDPRIDRALAEVAAMLAANPALAAVHPLDALAPDEDLMLLENAFLSSVPGSQANLPSYNAFYERDDGRISTREHRRMLQLLQWQRRRAGHAVDGRPWLLKAPAHMSIFEAMRETYPGARFIMSHRDPLACIPSISSLYFEFWRIASDHADPAACGRYSAHFYGAALDRTIAAAAKEPDRFLDLEYEDLMRRQDEVLERIYAFFGWPIEPQTRAGFARWRAENPRDRRKPHHYRIEDFGLTRRGLEQAYAGYRARRGYDRTDPVAR